MHRVQALVFALLAIWPMAGSGAVGQAGWRVYRDAEGRFSFSYPEAFGAPEPGTDNGYGDRVAAMRFPGLTGLGGEAVLTRGAVTVDLQALGGLYDPIALQALRPADVPRVRAAVPAVTADTFCRLLGEADHLGAAPALSGAPLTAARQVDRMRNIDPAVVTCRVEGAAIVFHKTSAYAAGAITAHQHIFGAIRFLTGRYSSFQIVRGSATAPGAEVLTALARLVNSFDVPAGVPAAAAENSVPGADCFPPVPANLRTGDRPAAGPAGNGSC